MNSTLNHPASAATCHGPATGGLAPGIPVVALAGAPNAGKSTLFNALTGLRATTGNWPGTTVDVTRGKWRTPTGGDLNLIDLPGAYSIDPLSPDEALTRSLLVDATPSERPDVVVVAVDAGHLTRSLHLVCQLREFPIPVVVALTMVDVASASGAVIDCEMLARTIGCPVVAVDPRRRTGLSELTDAVQRRLADAQPVTIRTIAPAADPLDREDERFTWIESAAAASVTVSGPERVTWSDRIDRFALHPVVGPLLFLAVMWVVFQVTTTVAAPLQDALDGFFSGPVSDAAAVGLAAIGLGGTWAEGLIVDGLIAGVGMLLTFAPLMALMFVLLAILEDSGYMARAAVVTDKLMRRLGLPGRAFLPLVVGFGCNVPAIAATRILADRRQRILTALLVPFTSCSARLTVYVMVGTIFFGAQAGSVVFLMYVASIVFVVGVGFVLRKTLWRTMGAEPMMIDLPTYHWPTVRLTAMVAWQRLQSFLKTASGIIVATVCVVWVLQSTPTATGQVFGKVPLADSAYGVAAQAIAPVFEPAGFGRWQTASALVVGFVAKEAVISSWAQTYAVEEPEAGGGSNRLQVAIRDEFVLSSRGHVFPAVWAFLAFLLAYTPCVATLAAQRREIGTRWTLFGIAVQLVVAWVVAVAVFQVGRLWW